ncbi:S-layer homology domain-containing protein [Paenibacillus sp. YIM B09110]|uniref:S-layer homology domain-containing protein n=1 Tax=Paenibacillus sp. YIM B09110 TaxID=3126102 RepID=UPI00301DAC43
MTVRTAASNFTTKTVSLFLILSLFIALVPAVQAEAASYSDVEKHWAKDTIAWAQANKIVDGYPDGTFKPNKLVTEAEFVKILLGAFKVQVGETAAGAHWTDAVYQSVDAFHYPVKGADSKEIRSQSINRLSVAEIIAGANGVNYEGSNAIHYLLANNLSKGKDSATIKGYQGEGLLTRAEAVQFIKNVKDAGMTELKVRPEAPSDPTQLPPLKVDISTTVKGAKNIVLDYALEDLKEFYPYTYTGDSEKVTWSLRFPFKTELPAWSDGEDYGIRIDPNTGRLTVGWYFWVGEFEVVATSQADGAIVGVQKVRLDYNNIKQITSSNGVIEFTFIDEPDWFEYEYDGKTYKANMNIDEVEISYDVDGEYTPIEITSREYDAKANKVTFRFAPFKATDKEQTFIVDIGYMESTYLSATVFTVPAAQ